MNIEIIDYAKSAIMQAIGDARDELELAKIYAELKIELEMQLDSVMNYFKEKKDER